jgi:hypothetical protein
MSHMDLPERNRLQRFYLWHAEKLWAIGLVVAYLGFWYVAGGVWPIIGLVAVVVGAAAAFAVGAAVMFAVAGIIMGIEWLVGKVRS